VYIGSQPFTSVQAASEFIDILRSAEDTEDYNASNYAAEGRFPVGSHKPGSVSSTLTPATNINASMEASNVKQSDTPAGGGGPGGVRRPGPGMVQSMLRVHREVAGWIIRRLQPC
jgi:hypothetical protein